jgi:hypothetical protein
MTVIAGLVHEGRVWLGADSAGSNSETITARADAKLFVVGSALIGCTGSYRGLQVARYAFKPPALPEGMDPHEYMCTMFVDGLREVWRAAGHVGRTSEIEHVETKMLVGMHGRLWTVDTDLQVGESLAPWAAGGSGELLALGSLHATAHVVGLRDQPEARVRLALQAACHHSPSCGGPLLVRSTP